MMYIHQEGALDMNIGDVAKVSVYLYLCQMQISTNMFLAVGSDWGQNPLPL